MNVGPAYLENGDDLGVGFSGERLRADSAGIAMELVLEAPVRKPWFLLGAGLTGHYQSLGEVDEMVSGLDFGPGFQARIGRWFAAYASAHLWLDVSEGDLCPSGYTCVGDRGSDPNRVFGVMLRAGLFATVPVKRDVFLVAGVTPRYLAAVGDGDQAMPRSHHALQFSLGLGW